VWDVETTTDRDRKATAALPVDEVTIDTQRNTTDAGRRHATLRTLRMRQTDNAQPGDTRDHLRRPSGVIACRREANRLDEWLPLYRLTTVSCVIGEAHVVIIDRSFIPEHPLASGWRSRQHGSW
jgi:hypothetical protein